MLSPKKIKFRKQQKGRIGGKSQRGSQIAFGDIALKTVEPGKITNKQIEAARVAMMRHIKRGGKVFIRIFPDKTITSKPAEVRMGKGKGSPEGWCAPVRTGRILYELAGVADRELAREALVRASHKLPVKTVIVEKES